MAKKPRAGRARRVRRKALAIENRQRAVTVAIAPLEVFFRKICGEIGLGYSPASVCFVTDREMKRLNGRYRKKHKTTDVLSFPSEVRSRPASLESSAALLRGEFLGDIAISPTVARQNGKLHGRSMAKEIRVLLLHGILHLMGYDHDSDGGKMERVEAKLQRRLRLG
jgi:probable rRNA maturation factor